MARIPLLVLFGALASVAAAHHPGLPQAAIDSFYVCRLPLAPLFPVCAADVVHIPRTVADSHHALDDALRQLESSTRTGRAAHLYPAYFAVWGAIVEVKESNIAVTNVLPETLSGFVGDFWNASFGLSQFYTEVNYEMFNRTSIFDAFLKFVSDSMEAADPAAERAALSSRISDLLVDASAVSASLARLEDHLGTVHGLCAQEASITAAAWNQLLWRPWTLLGRGADEMRDLGRRGEVLEQVEQFRGVATETIGSAAEALSRVRADLMELQVHMAHAYSSE